MQTKVEKKFRLPIVEINISFCSLDMAANALKGSIPKQFKAPNKYAQNEETANNKKIFSKQFLKK